MAIMTMPDLTPLQWAVAVVLLLLGSAGIYYIGANGGFDILCEQWALMVVVLLLACAGIYHIGARLAGYKVLPMYQPNACGGEKKHELAYITEDERNDLIMLGGEGVPKFGTQGVPCYARNNDETLEDWGTVAKHRREKYDKMKGNTMLTWGPDPRRMWYGRSHTGA